MNVDVQVPAKRSISIKVLAWKAARTCSRQARSDITLLRSMVVLQACSFEVKFYFIEEHTIWVAEVLRHHKLCFITTTSYFEMLSYNDG